MRRLVLAGLMLLASVARSAAPPIRLILIDRATIAAYGPLPWGREHHAKLVSILDKAGAKAIVLRFYFKDPHDVPGDAALVAAAKKSGKVFVEIGRADAPAGWQPPDEWLAGQAVAIKGASPKKLFASALVQVPYEELARAVRGVGSIDVMVNKEKKLEGIPLLVKYRAHLMPSLAFRVFLATAGLDSAILAFEQSTRKVFGVFHKSETKYLRVDEKRIALDQYGCVPVNLTAPGSGYPIASFVDVVKGNVKPKWFKNAVVLVGAETPELDVDTSTGAKSGLELVADQLAALYQYTADAAP
jgi:CHASE2 domain-containing sensor protein